MLTLKSATTVVLHFLLVLVVVLWIAIGLFKTRPVHTTTLEDPFHQSIDAGRTSEEIERIIKESSSFQCSCIPDLEIVFRPFETECITNKTTPLAPGADPPRHGPPARGSVAPLPGPVYLGGYYIPMLCPGSGSNRIFINVSTSYVRSSMLGTFPEVLTVAFGSYYSATHLDRDPAYSNMQSVANMMLPTVYTMLNDLTLVHSSLPAPQDMFTRFNDINFAVIERLERLSQSAPYLMPSWENLTDPMYLNGATEWLPGANLTEIAADYATARDDTYKVYGNGTQPSQSLMHFHR